MAVNERFGRDQRASILTRTTCFNTILMNRELQAHGTRVVTLDDAEESDNPANFLAYHVKHDASRN